MTHYQMTVRDLSTFLRKVDPDTPVVTPDFGDYMAGDEMSPVHAEVTVMVYSKLHRNWRKPTDTQTGGTPVVVIHDGGWCPGQ